MKTLETRDDRTLGELLQALRDDGARSGPPDRVRAAVMDAWDTRPTARVDHAPVGVWPSAAALAAGAVLAVALARLGGALQSGILPSPVESAATLHLVGEPFAEGEALRVVRMRMAPALLASLGIRSTAGDLAESVAVDVIVGEDGVARAIRVGM